MKYLRRVIWYIAGRLFLVCLIAGMVLTVFYYAMNLTQIQIILKDGMANRAKVIMGMETDRGILNNYFQPSCLAADEALQASGGELAPYADYNIRGIDHRLEMGFLWTWPWDTSVRLNVTERIPRIDGRVKGTRAEELIARDGPNAVYPPEWPDAMYRVSLYRENGQWKIRNLTRIGE